MFVSATEAFFDPSLDPDYLARIERWAAATTDLYEAFPDDLDVRALFALTRLATASRFGAAADHHAQAHEVLATVLREEPTDLLERAIELDEATPKHPVTPGAQLPAMEMLGQLSLELDDPRRARRARVVWLVTRRSPGSRTFPCSIAAGRTSRCVDGAAFHPRCRCKTSTISG